MYFVLFFFSSRRRHTRCALVTGVQTCALPISKDGMLKRLQDSEDSYVEDWSVRVFESRSPAVSIANENTYSDRPLYSEPAYGYHYVVEIGRASCRERVCQYV